MNDKLQAYFDVARAQEPVMDKTELENLLGRTGVVVKKKRWFNLNIFITMITLSACTLAVWLLITNQPAPEVILAETEIKTGSGTENQPDVKDKQQQQARIIHEPSIRMNSNEPGAMKIEGSTGVLQLPVYGNNDAPEVEMTGQSKAYINESGYVVLSDEELAGLGIITNGNTLTYANITDRGERQTGNGLTSFMYPFYKIEIEEHGSSRTNITQTNEAEIITGSKTFWPALLTRINKKDTSVQAIEHNVSAEYPKLFQHEVASFLVPVFVELKAKPGPLSHDLKLIFWFKAEDSFFRALPPGIRDEIMLKYRHININAYYTILAHYSPINYHASPVSIDSLLIRELTTHIIYPKRAALNKLRIKADKNVFSYDNRVVRHNKVHELRIMGTESSVIFPHNSPDLVKVRKWDIDLMPVALTNIDMSTISYFYHYPDSVSNLTRQKLNEQQFVNSCRNLVPVKVHHNYLFWYEPADQLSSLVKEWPAPVLSPASVFGHAELMSLQKAYLRLKEADFEKLNAFTPVALSDFNISKINHVRNNPHSRVKTDSAFVKEAHNLAGIIVSNEDRLVIWYELSEEFTEAVASFYYATKPDLSLVKFLNLTVEEKKKLGITQNEKGTNIPSAITDRTTIYSTYNRSGSEHEFRIKPAVEFAGDKPAKQVVLHPQDTLSFKKTYDMKMASGTKYPSPVLVTNSTGLVWYMYNLDNGDEIPLNKLENEQFMKQKRNEDREKLVGQLGSFVPVKIDVEERYKSSNKHIGLIAWYKPDSLFLHALHEEVANELKAELDALNNNKPASTCKYFDACGNHAGVIYTFNLYPNPVGDQFTIEVGLNEARNLDISVVDINGRLVKKLAVNKQQDKGLIGYTYPAGNLPEGLYLLLITTDKGERITQRLIKKQP
ncbi:MAG: T9SS type A sorting domain-containing protein [Bacteroidota bacterium]